MEKSMEGIYKCLASNIAGTTKVELKLNVQFPPEISFYKTDDCK